MAIFTIFPFSFRTSFINNLLPLLHITFLSEINPFMCFLFKLMLFVFNLNLFNVCCKASLVAVDYFSFCLPGRLFIFPSILNDDFAG